MSRILEKLCDKNNENYRNNDIWYISLFCKYSKTLYDDFVPHYFRQILWSIFLNPVIRNNDKVIPDSGIFIWAKKSAASWLEARTTSPLE